MNDLGYLYRRQKKIPPTRPVQITESDGLPDQIHKEGLKYMFILYIVLVL